MRFIQGIAGRRRQRQASISLPHPNNTAARMLCRIAAPATRGFGGEGRSARVPLLITSSLPNLYTNCPLILFCVPIRCLLSVVRCLCSLQRRRLQTGRRCAVVGWDILSSFGCRRCLYMLLVPVLPCISSNIESNSIDQADSVGIKKNWQGLSSHSLVAGFRGSILLLASCTIISSPSPIS
jgi:hypothetical protein